MNIHDIIEIGGAILAVLGSYGGARAGISKALTLAELAMSSATRAHTRIDDLTDRRERVRA